MGFIKDIDAQIELLNQESAESNSHIIATALSNRIKGLLIAKDIYAKKYDKLPTTNPQAGEHNVC